MMVERTSLSRRTNRNQYSLPYARPPQRAFPDKKSSLSSIFNGIINWFKSTNELDEDEPADEQEAGPSNSAAQSLVDRGNDMATVQGTLLPPPRRSDDPQPPPLTSQPSDPQLPGGPPPIQAQTSASQFSFSSTSPPAARALTSPSPVSEGPPRNNIDTVTNYLNRRMGMGQSLDPVEIAGVVALLKQEGALEDEKPEPFRFSTSPSTRGPSPSSGALIGSASAPAVAGEPKKPRMLTKNPNGVYRWQGAGSARPRNRYQSSGFGPSRSQPTVTINTEKAATTDAKRRRVGEEAQTSTSQRALAPAPAANGGPSTSAISGVSNPPSGPFLTTQRSPPPQPATSTSKSNGLAPPAAPRLRTTGITKPTAPAVPSPLRNSWSNDPSPPSSAVSRPTRAAALMTDILREVTPSEKKKDLINPYEALYPGNLKQLPKKKPLKRKSKEGEKAAAQAAKEQKPEEKRKETVLSPSRIIEATVPKGAKRARPPPELVEKQKSTPSTQQPRKAEPLRSAERQTASNGSSSVKVPSKERAKPSVTVEEVSDEDQPSPQKKAKTKAAAPTSAVPPAPSFAASPVSAFAAPAAPALAHAAAKPPVPQKFISIEEVEDQDMESDSVVKPSQVIEPEEGIRRSPSPTSPSSTSAAANPSGPKSAFGAKSSAPKAPSKLRYSIQPEKDEQMSDVEKKDEDKPTAESAKSSVSAPFGVTQSAKRYPANTAEAKDFVKSLPKFELTAYSFDIPASSPGAGPSSVKARETAKTSPVSELPTYSFNFTALPAPASSTTSGFNWAAAGAKKPAEADDQWTCSMCMLKNPDSAKEKCTVCEAPRPGAAPKEAPKAFDWSAAGIKKPDAAGVQWTCSTCMLQNPDSAKEKCTVCEAPRPGAAPKEAPKAFDWAAAGMKAQPAPSAGSWTCAECMLQNPDSATDKCTVCEAPRPDAKPAAPAAKGFDWAAAGMKQPTAVSGWACKVCMLQNPADAKKCTVCDEPR